MGLKLLRASLAAALGLGLAAAPGLAQDAPGAAEPQKAAPDAPAAPAVAPPTNAAPPAKVDPAPVGPSGSADPSSAVTDNMQPSGTILTEEIRRATVKSTAGEDLASVSDLVVDREGRLAGAVLSVGGVLGVGAKQVLVPWRRITVAEDGETITLAMSRQQLEAMPAFQPLPQEEATSGAVSATKAAPSQ
jgi:sporulation protein YlmC with PRC-barrel domain